MEPRVAARGGNEVARRNRGSRWSSGAGRFSLRHGSEHCNVVLFFLPLLLRVLILALGLGRGLANFIRWRILRRLSSVQVG